MGQNVLSHQLYGGIYIYMGGGPFHIYIYIGSYIYISIHAGHGDNRLRRGGIYKF